MGRDQGKGGVWSGKRGARKGEPDLMGVDGRVHDDPGASTQLSPGGQVHEGRPLVRPQSIHYQAARLQVGLS